MFSFQPTIQTNPQQNMEEIRIKAKYGEQCRRFRIPSNLNFQQFLTQLHQVFRSVFDINNIRLKYFDDEGDQVNLETEEEWKEAIYLGSSSDSKLLKVVINSKQIKGDDVCKEVRNFFENVVTESGKVVNHEKVQQLYKNITEKIKDQETRNKFKTTLKNAGTTLGFVIEDVMSEFESGINQAIPAIEKGIRDAEKYTTDAGKFVAKKAQEWTVDVDKTGAKVSEGSPSQQSKEQPKEQLPKEQISKEQPMEQQPNEEVKLSKKEEKKVLQKKEPEEKNDLSKIINEVSEDIKNGEKKVDEEWTLVENKKTEEAPKEEEIKEAPKEVQPEVIPSARFVEDITIQDGEQLDCGSVFTKVWRVKNTGNAKWSKSTCLEYLGGNDDLNIPLKTRFPVPIAEKDEEVDISVDLKAPAKPGEYKGYFRLVDAQSGEQFGHRLYFQIIAVEKIEEENEQPKEEKQEEKQEEGKWSQELKFLADMGFTDADQLIPFLEKHNGDLSQTVHEVLNI